MLRQLYLCIAFQISLSAPPRRPEALLVPDLHLLLEDAVERHLNRLPAPLMRVVRLHRHAAAEQTYYTDLKQLYYCTDVLQLSVLCMYSAYAR